MPSNLYNPDTPPEGSYDLSGFHVPQEDDVVRAMSGDKEAFGRLVERYQGMVYTLAYNALGTHVDAEDAARECSARLPQAARLSRRLGVLDVALRLAVNAVVDCRGERAGRRYRPRSPSALAFPTPMPSSASATVSL